MNALQLSSNRFMDHTTLGTSELLRTAPELTWAETPYSEDRQLFYSHRASILTCSKWKLSSIRDSLPEFLDFIVTNASDFVGQSTQEMRLCRPSTMAFLCWGWKNRARRGGGPAARPPQRAQSAKAQGRPLAAVQGRGGEGPKQGAVVHAFRTED